MSVLGELEDGLPAIGDEPLIAWRKWNLSNGDLLSMNGEPWLYREPFTAMCAAKKTKETKKAHGELVPSGVCSCGVYAGKTMHLLGGAGYGISLAEGIPPGEAWGSVKLWGRVVAHERGYRAQYAYPDRLFVGTELAAELIRLNYGCDVTVLKPAPLPLVQSPAETGQSVGDAQILHGLGANINFTVNSYNFNYSGPLDPIAIGRWFAGILAQEAGKNQLAVNMQYWAQIQLCFYRP